MMIAAEDEDLEFYLVISTLMFDFISSDADKENEEGSKVRPKSAIRLDTVVNMIDSVKDEMNFFKEKVRWIV